MPRREDEAVTVGPTRLRGIVPHVASPKHVRHGRRPHGQSRVAGVGFLHTVDRKEANGVDAKLVELVRTQTGLRSRSCVLQVQGISPPHEWI